MDSMDQSLLEWYRVVGTGELPLPEDIRRSGLRAVGSREHDLERPGRSDAVDILASLGVAKPKEPRKAELVHLGEGLMPLPRRTVERIQGGEFVEFADFPVMDGGTWAMELPEQDLGDRILVVQAPDKRKSKREVPDASMWGSCFTLFERALLLADPARGPGMSAYRETIQKAARTHQWDFVLRYDR